MNMFRCGLWASSGPFPLSAHYGLYKRGRDPPTNPSHHLKKERSALPLKWLLKKDQGRRPTAASATATAAALLRAAVVPAALLRAAVVPAAFPCRAAVVPAAFPCRDHVFPRADIPTPLPPLPQAATAATGLLCHHPYPLHGPISLPPPPPS